VKWWPSARSHDRLLLNYPSSPGFYGNVRSSSKFHPPPISSCSSCIPLLLSVAPLKCRVFRYDPCHGGEASQPVIIRMYAPGRRARHPGGVARAWLWPRRARLGTLAAHLPENGPEGAWNVNARKAEALLVVSLIAIALSTVLEARAAGAPTPLLSSRSAGVPDGLVISAARHSPGRSIAATPTVTGTASLRRSFSPNIALTLPPIPTTPAPQKPGNFQLRSTMVSPAVLFPTATPAPPFRRLATTVSVPYHDFPTPTLRPTQLPLAATPPPQTQRFQALSTRVSLPSLIPTPTVPPFLRLSTRVRLPSSDFPTSTPTPPGFPYVSPTHAAWPPITPLSTPTLPDLPTSAAWPPTAPPITPPLR
jgi:hypothetical protein